VSRSAPASPHPSQSQAVLEAVLERITYANEDTGYTIARVATERTGPDLLTVVGALLGAQVGESLRLTGRWGSHPKYGKQFHVDSFTTVLPATIQGIRRYLGSGMIKGIGPMMAERMVTHFGTEILSIIEQQPGRLIEVHGLGPKRTKKIADAWEEQKAIKEVMVFLSGVGVSTSLAVRIYKTYADSSISVVRAEPYRLASEVWGIGFKTADTIAQAVGIPHDSPQRIKAGLQYTLSQAADNGHCYLPERDLVREATKILEVDRELIGPCLDELVVEEGVVREPLPVSDAAVSRHGPVGSVELARGAVGGVRAGRLGQGAGLAAAPDRPGPRRRPATGGHACAHEQGRGADRRPRVREELHRPLDRQARDRQAGDRGAGRADRPGRQAPGGADRT
jgi:exodeoxyribonuclease V alpha subunit